MKIISMKKLFFIAIAAIVTAGAYADEPRRPFRPKFNPENPDAHDPVMACEDGVYYTFTTGFGIGVMSSADMKTWKQEKSPLTPAPQWAMDLIPAYKGHTWAPDIIKWGDRWYLYYSCSAFGKNTSAIGVATNKTLNPESPDYKWEDLGLVVQSIPGETNWNAIDPNVVIDDNGEPWLTYGSFWDGIQLVKLQRDMKTMAGEPVTIARRKVAEPSGKSAGDNAIEAPFIVKRDGWYYLFVSHDYCCRGLKSNYKTAVGRSKNVEGPYVDKEGKPLSEGGGTVIAAEDNDYAGVGHCSAYDFDGNWWFVAHGYDKNQRGASKLVVKPIVWNDGWPELD